LVRGWAFEADPAPSSELYVFPAPDSANTVIGLLISSDQAISAPTNAHIHVGTKTWSAEFGGPACTPFASNGRVRSFSGVGMIGARFVKAMVLELDAREFTPTSAVDVWAEISHGERLRQRVGSPIVAELVRCDREFRQIHRRITPIDDRAILTPIVTRLVSARAKRSGITTDPDAYACRLADAILPDVIRFDPASPTGFSYASQNGRHPRERTAEIVQTLLGGSFAPVVEEQGTMLFDRFPYLISPTERTVTL
jgi:hypothetical protein